MAEESGEIKNPPRIKYPSGCLGKIVIVAATIIAVLLVQRVPAWLSGKFLPALAESAGIAGVEANVTTLGLSRAELRNAHVRIDGRRSVSVNTIRVHYSLPLYPFKKSLRIRKIEAIGLRINVTGKDGQWTVPGIYPELFGNRQTAKSGGAQPEQLILSDCEIRIEHDGRILSVPLSARINMPPEPDSIWRARANVRFAGDILGAEAHWNRGSGEGRVKFQAELKYSNYSRLFPELRENLFANAVCRGEISGRCKPGEPPAGLNGELVFSKLTAGSSGVMVGAPSGRQFVLAFSQQEASRFIWECSGLEILHPVKAELLKGDGRLTLSDAKCSIAGTLATSLARQAGISRDLPITHDFEFNWHRVEHKGDWQYRTLLTESGWDDKYNSKFERFEANCSGEIDGSGVRSQIRLAATPALEFQVNGRQFAVSEPVMSGEIMWAGALSGHAGLAVKNITAPELKAQTGPLRIVFPLTDGEQGSLKLQDVKFREYKLDELDYTILKNGSQLEMNGEIRQGVLPALQCFSRIRIALLPEANVDAEVEISNGENERTMDLGRLLPKLNGMTLDGRLSGRGRYQWSAKRHGGEFLLALNDGVLKSEALSLEASGLELKVDFPALPELKTAPLQKLSCRKLKVKDFIFENVNAEFMLDEQPAFILEKLGLNWCGGSVFTYSLRFVPGGRNVDATIYFDRLNISQIIGQAGLIAAEGNGTIYGRVPLALGRDGIILQPGFFYSVPGETRNIRFGNLANMLEAVPPGTPQYNQLDLTIEALKDFNYDWIKVDFRTEGDKLLVVSRFDGRPVNMLPFAYDEQSGGMTRRNGAKANFQGIRLELNTSLPLNQLLQFNTQLKKLFGGNK